MAIQTISRAQVSRGRPYISQKQKNTPRGETSQNTGVRNGRLMSRVGEPQHEHAGADDRKGQQRADGDQFAQQPDREQPRDEHGDAARSESCASQGVRNLGCTALKTGGSKPSLDIV